MNRETRKIRRSRSREKRRGWISRLQVIGLYHCVNEDVHLCSVSLQKSWHQGYLALTSFITMTVICWQDASVFGGMFVNELALSDSVAAVSGHITPQ